MYAYKYKFDVAFFCGLSATSDILTAIKNAEQRFNSIQREAGQRKHLTVHINENGGLTYELSSENQIDERNRLLCTQQFSKDLSTEPGMESYVVPDRMMERV